jgi:cytochrome c553
MRVAMILAVGLTLAAHPAAAADGKALFADKGCPACHGEGGAQPVDSAPILAGQNGTYLGKQLKDFAENHRATTTPLPMPEVAKGLSSEEISTLAAWLSSLPRHGVKQDEEGEGADLFIDHGCHGCHGPGGGKPLSPDYPVIGGQKKDYLAGQIRNIRDDVRINGRARLMISFARDLTDAQVEKIAGYLAGN